MDGLFKSLITCIILSLFAGFIQAANIYVDGNAIPGGNGSSENPYQYIQDGINAAVNIDTVIVLDGIYKGAQNKNLDFKGKTITVTSQNGAESTIIDCENDGRGFYFYSGEGPDSVVNGFTITNGYADYGGGIMIYGASPTIQNNVISYCIFYKYNFDQFIRKGGGVYCYGSESIIRDNKILGNRADVGGGIYCEKSSPIIEGNIISGNDYCFSSGSIHCAGSSPIITNY